MAATKAAKAATVRNYSVFSKSYFPVDVAVFEHLNDGRRNYSVRLSRAFRRDEQSQWESTEYLRPEDLLPAARLLGEAFEAIQGMKDKAYRERQGAEANGDGHF